MNSRQAVTYIVGLPRALGFLLSFVCAQPWMDAQEPVRKQLGLDLFVFSTIKREMGDVTVVSGLRLLLFP